MGFRSEIDPADNAGTEFLASRFLNENLSVTKKLRAQLPKNRELLRKIRDYGLQAI